MDMPMGNQTSQVIIIIFNVHDYIQNQISIVKTI